MMTDLFYEKTVKEKVRDFCKSKGFFTSGDMRDFENSLKGQPGYLSADRRKRELMVAGLIRSLKKEEKIFRGFPIKIGVYEWVER